MIALNVTTRIEQREVKLLCQGKNCFAIFLMDNYVSIYIFIIDKSLKEKA